MSKYSVLPLILYLTTLVTGAVAVVPPGSRYNVVLVIFDDLRPALGAYGDSLARTPHLDAFAQGSTIFTRAYSQVRPFGMRASKSLFNQIQCALPSPH